MVKIHEFTLHYFTVMIIIFILDSNVTHGSHVKSANSAAPSGEVLATKSFPLLPEEPTCEQLRAMWIFSKRQSRAAELTNEIPTYRDPFTYNVWNPYYALGRNSPHPTLDGIQMATARHTSNTRSPVFGRVISQEPVLPQFANPSNIDIGQKSQFPKISSVNGTKRPMTQYRYVGGTPISSSTSNGQMNSATNPNSLTVQGSFHKLKELIWTERAKELTQQRRLEEMAARAAVLKEIANGQNIQGSYKQQQPQQQHHSESMLMDENRSPEMELNHAENGRKFMQHKQQQQQRPQNIPESERNSQQQRGGSNRSFSHRATNRHKSYHGGLSSRYHERPPPTSPYYKGQPQQQMHKIDDLNDDIAADNIEFSRSTVPRWRNAAGIVQKYMYTMPRGTSHFRERQRALFKEMPVENKYYQRITRNKEKNNNEIHLLHEILQELSEQYNNNANIDNIDDVIKDDHNIYNADMMNSQIPQDEISTDDYEQTADYVGNNNNNWMESIY